MNKIIYKHRKTNDLVVKKDDYFHFFDGDCISERNKLPLLMVVDSADWELITNEGRDSFELLLDTNNEIYFKSIITGQEYRIGNEITIKKYVSFGDRRRNFKIRRWYIGDGPVKRNIFNYVYAHTECDDRPIHLSDVIVKTEKRYNQIIDEVYEKYGQKITKEQFIDKCKTDKEFSEKWGLKIEERELSLDEREDLKLKLILDYLKKNGIISSTFEDFKNDEKLIPNIDWRREVWGLIGWIDYGNSIQTSRLEEIYDGVKHIPAKQITLTYQNESIQFYE